MDSLLTLSVGEYSSAEIVLRVTGTLTAMTAVLLALSSGSVARIFRFPLILSAVALGGASWFELGVWLSWREAFELAGTSYAVTGYLPADGDRIIAWSLGAPTLLFSFGLGRTSWEKKTRLITLMGFLFLALALAAPFSGILALAILVYANVLFYKNVDRSERNKGVTLSLETHLAMACVFAGVAFSVFYSWHPLSLGGGVGGELVRGEILRSVTDIFSLVVPALLLLIGTLRISASRSDSGE